MNYLFLALAHIRHRPWRSIILVFVVSLILAVPLVLQTLLGASQSAMTARAEATPLVIGRSGSQLDLTMKALYFSDDAPALVSVATENAVWDSGYANAIPLYARYSANDAPVVGTSIDYFDFRKLELAQGRRFARLGEAVIGADVAARLSIGVGDTVFSDPENLFDLAGSYPLAMEVVGVLAPTDSPDDLAVLVDVKTAWVIEGLGHGHEDVVAVDANGDTVRAAAGLVQFNRITDSNLDSFHFHGSPEDFPLTAVLAVPYDTRSETILRGRYLGAEAIDQVVVPKRVVEALLAQVVQIKRLIDAVLATVALATLLALGLLLFLSAQMRNREAETAFMLGAPAGLVWRLLAVEMALLLGLAAIVATLLAVTLRSYAPAILAAVV